MMDAFDFIENHNRQAAEMVESCGIEVLASENIPSSVARIVYEGDFEGAETSECEISMLEEFIFGGVKQIFVNPGFEPLDPDVIPAGEKVVFNLRDALNDIGDTGCLLDADVVELLIRLHAAVGDAIRVCADYVEHFREVHPDDKARIASAFTLTS